MVLQGIKLTDMTGYIHDSGQQALHPIVDIAAQMNVVTELTVSVRTPGNILR